MARTRRFLFCMALLVTSWAGAAETQAPATAFDRDFTAETMRIDYFHTADGGREILALDRVLADGPWPGSRTRLLDELNLGGYLFEVRDRDTNRLLFSRGFDSIFGEWVTTSEAKTRAATFHESLRLPWPRRPVQIVLKRRDGNDPFREVWTFVVDPASRGVNRARAATGARVWPILESGPAAQKVDVAVLGEGYTEAELPKFHADAKRLVDALFATEPFKSRKTDFNVWGIDLPSTESGVHRVRAKQHRRTPLSAEYNIFDSERYVLTYDNAALRDAAAAAPYEFLEILVNEKQYGGGGIFNFQATAAVDTGFAEYVFIHEFGHHFAGLADEYYTSQVSYETGGVSEKPEPWAPNVTALRDPANVKWKDLVAAGTPLPTPWKKKEFERESEAAQKERAQIRATGAPESKMDELFRRQQVFETKLLSTMEHSGKVGAFEGASYEYEGLYRPEADCIMFTRDEVGFCRVCRRAIERVIDLYARP